MEVKAYVLYATIAEVYFAEPYDVQDIRDAKLFKAVAHCELAMKAFPDTYIIQEITINS
jgi:hypothetical protein